MRKQCLTQWDLKWNVSFGLQSGLFDLTRYVEKLGRLNRCNELALSVKWMPMRPSPTHVLWTDKAVFSLVSKLCALQCGRECLGLFCCAATALWNAGCCTGSAERFLAWKKDRSMWILLKGFLQFCAVHLFLTVTRIRFSFPQKRKCSFVICLLILASWRSFKS